MRVKGGRCVGLTTLPPSCADCLEIWEPQPTGTLRALSKLVMGLFYFIYLFTFILLLQGLKSILLWMMEFLLTCVRNATKSD